jgi:tetratricopeptide (TPR) repeat protein
MRYILVPVSVMLIAATTTAGDTARYQSCMAAVKSEPAKALEMATSWRAEGGSVPAMHCQALALIEQGNAARGAGVLDAAAAALGPQPKAKGFAGEIFAQAGNAWLMAGDSTRATARLTTALALLPDTGDARTNALVDRARAQADKAAWTAVIADLNAAATLAPSNAEVFLLRATAKRRSGDLGGARNDILMASSLAPANVDVLIERGISHAQSQSLESALADWRQVIKLAPGSDQAKIAQAYLDQFVPRTPAPKDKAKAK